MNHQHRLVLPDASQRVMPVADIRSTRRKTSSLSFIGHAATPVLGWASSMSWMGPDVSLVPGRSDGLPRTDVSTVANALNYYNSSGWKACKATVAIPVNGAVACGIGAINDEKKAAFSPEATPTAHPTSVIT